MTFKKNVNLKIFLRFLVFFYIKYTNVLLGILYVGKIYLTIAVRVYTERYLCLIYIFINLLSFNSYIIHSVCNNIIIISIKARRQVISSREKPDDIGILFRMALAARVGNFV